MGIITKIKKKNRNKDRLYVALYRGPRPDQWFEGKARTQGNSHGFANIPPDEEFHEREFTWAFLVGPKDEPKYAAVAGMRLDVTADPWRGTWVMRRLHEINLKHTGTDMLVRVLVGKIKDRKRLWETLFTVPVDEDSHHYRNKHWLIEALAALRASDGIMSDSSCLDFNTIEHALVGLADKMQAEGRFDGYQNMNIPKPAWDLINGRYLYQ